MFYPACQDIPMLLTNRQVLEAVQENAVAASTAALRGDEHLGQAIQTVSGNLARVLAHTNRTSQFLHDVISPEEFKEARNGMILEVLNAIVEETLSQCDDWVGTMGVNLGDTIQHHFVTR